MRTNCYRCLLPISELLWPEIHPIKPAPGVHAFGIAGLRLPVGLSVHLSRFTIHDFSRCQHQLRGSRKHQELQKPKITASPSSPAHLSRLSSCTWSNGRLPRRRPRRGGRLRSRRPLRRPNCLFARRLDWRRARNSTGEKRWLRAGGTLL